MKPEKETIEEVMYVNGCDEEEAERTLEDYNYITEMAEKTLEELIWIYRYY